MAVEIKALGGLWEALVQHPGGLQFQGLDFSGGGPESDGQVTSGIRRKPGPFPEGFQ